MSRPALIWRLVLLLGLTTTVALVTQLAFADVQYPFYGVAAGTSAGVLTRLVLRRPHPGATG